MYQGTGELKNFQSPKSSTQVTNQSMFKYNQDTSQMSIILQLKSSSSVMTLITKCQSPTVKVKYKCDDLVNQVSITNSDHYQLLVDLYSIKAQSTLK